MGLLDFVTKIHILLDTNLSHKWQFCSARAPSDGCALFNSTSYLVALCAMIVLLYLTIVTRVQQETGRRLSTSWRFIVLAFCVCPVSHFLWPALMLISHFLSCSYYPYTASATILVLYFKLITSYDASYLRPHSKEDSQNRMEGEEEQPEGGTPIFASTQTTESIPAGVSSTSGKKNSSNKDVKPAKESSIPTNVSPAKESSLHTNVSPARLSGPSRGAKTTTDYKKSYCGRCGKERNLPFRPGFSTLREPSRTRAGTIYGPPRYFLNDSDFMEQYAIGRNDRN